MKEYSVFRKKNIFAIQKMNKIAVKNAEVLRNAAFIKIYDKNTVQSKKARLIMQMQKIKWDFILYCPAL